MINSPVSRDHPRTTCNSASLQSPTISNPRPRVACPNLRLLYQMVGGVTCGDCVDVMAHMPSACVDLILTDPPYLVRYRDRSGRTLVNDDNDAWLEPSFQQMYRVLRRDALCLSFYGWNAIDRFMAAWRKAGFRVVGHIVFRKRYASSRRFLRYQHECAYLLAKGSP